MGTTAQKLQNILNAKSALKTAIAKYKSSIGNVLNDYAPIVSEMADLSNNFMDFATTKRISELTIKFNGTSTLRPYLFYNVNADNVYIESGFTATSESRQFTYLNRDANSTQICYLHLPNSITSVSTNNTWAGSINVIPVLENGWKANFSIAGLPTTYNQITKAVLEDMIDALADLTGQTGKTLTLGSSSQYNLISASKLAEATAKNWTVTY